VGDERLHVLGPCPGARPPRAHLSSERCARSRATTLMNEKLGQGGGPEGEARLKGAGRYGYRTCFKEPGREWAHRYVRNVWEGTAEAFQPAPPASIAVKKPSTPFARGGGEG
jgi:hypothetical protein